MMLGAKRDRRLPETSHHSMPRVPLDPESSSGVMGRGLSETFRNSCLECRLDWCEMLRSGSAMLAITVNCQSTDFSSHAQRCGSWRR